MLRQELEDRFNQTGLLPPLLPLESHLLNATNGLCFLGQLDEVKSSCYKDNFDFDHLQRHLSFLVGVIKQGTPMAKES